MSKKELLILIEAISNLEEISKAIESITGDSGISGHYRGIWRLEGIVMQHSKYAKAKGEDIRPEFQEILHDTSLSIETKYNLLCGK